ncbi:LysR family transcriptional regulator [Aureimonas altamirensis]|uniref:LysR family transcriptional regulator n=1 Tax=Aureimonas altamirensis TaxID=370622 RepID=UPI001E4C028D|nr:LysR family transcriptional regulator [Aureimonas altamirensis]UHD43811.1 LysR family transcriptional regulator [Aureimonas altamirensis]
MTTTAPNLSIKQMRAIQTVARYSSFVAASVDMRMSQPGISRLIRTAEEELGVALFHRSTRQVIMTSAGLQLLPVVDRMLAEFDLAARALSSMRSSHHGHVVVASPMSIASRMLAEIVTNFRRHHPEVTIEIREALRSEVVHQIRFGVVDFGLASFMEGDDDLIVDQLCDVAYHVVVPARHRFAARKQVALKELSGEPLVSLPPHSIIRQIFDGAAAREGFTLNHKVIVSSPVSIYGLVESGAGISIQNGASVRSHLNDHLAACPIDPPRLTSQIATVRMKSRLMSPGAESFMRVVSDFFRSHPCT